MSRLAPVERYFRERPAMAIAVSGGVDSMTLAVVAHRARPGTEMFHAVSAAVPGPATQRVRAHAEKEGWTLHVVDAGEMRDPRYVANPANRCYFCKANLYRAITARTGLAVASGTNLDDLGDYRPGLIAAEERRVCHPWVELGVNKSGLRAIAAELDLHDLKDLPAGPCLSSRVTTGIAIDANLLPVIHEAENLVAGMLAGALPVNGIRCRILEAGVAIQLDTEGKIDPRAPWHGKILAGVAALFAGHGYGARARRVTVEPYRRGSAFLVGDAAPVKAG